MTRQEQFEADYLAAFPNMESDGDVLLSRGVYTPYADPETERAFRLWLQQAKRHEAGIAELVASLKEMEACYCTVGPNMSSVSRQTHRAALMRARNAIAKYEAGSC